MPQGKGTYGSKVGRPPTKKSPTKQGVRRRYDPKSGLTKEQWEKKETKDMKAFLETRKRIEKMAKDPSIKRKKELLPTEKSSTKKSPPPKMASPLEYAPFKMKAADYGNSPMQKNFGVGDSEMAIKTAPVKFGGVRGIMDKLRGGKGGQMPQSASTSSMAQKVMGATQNPQSAAMSDMAAKVGAGGGVDGGVMDPMGMGGGMGAVDTSNSFAPQVEQQAGGGEGEGGAVPPHGPEAHTGGAAPIGGAQKKRGLGNFLFGGGGVRG